VLAFLISRFVTKHRIKNKLHRKS